MVLLYILCIKLQEMCIRCGNMALVAVHIFLRVWALVILLLTALIIFCRFNMSRAEYLLIWCVNVWKRIHLALQSTFAASLLRFQPYTSVLTTPFLSWQPTHLCPVLFSIDCLWTKKRKRKINSQRCVLDQDENDVAKAEG